MIVPHHGDWLWKADPYARHAETRPKTASKVYDFPEFQWSDEKWMKQRTVPFQLPLNIYEVELGSFKKRRMAIPILIVISRYINSLCERDELHAY